MANITTTPIHADFAATVNNGDVVQLASGEYAVVADVHYEHLTVLTLHTNERRTVNELAAANPYNVRYAS